MPAVVLELVGSDVSVGAETRTCAAITAAA
jgi:hypothetical protein